MRVGTAPTGTMPVKVYPGPEPVIPVRSIAPGMEGSGVPVNVPLTMKVLPGVVLVEPVLMRKVKVSARATRVVAASVAQMSH